MAKKIYGAKNLRIRHLIVLMLFLISMTVLLIACPFIAQKLAMDWHFLYEDNNGVNSVIPKESPTSQQTQKPEQHFSYHNIRENKPEYDISMHVLEINPANSNVFVKPVTSHETLFGYALLSDINNKWNAAATVNGGFSHSNGLVGGLYAMEGKLLTAATGMYPALFMADEKAFIENVKTSIWLKADETRLESLYFNQFPEGEGLYVFTPDYGSKNRIASSNLTVVVSDRKVKEISIKNGSCEIPKDGFLISAIGNYAIDRLRDAVKQDMAIEIKYDIIAESGIITGFDWAYECGSQILKNGETVVPSKDNWVGTLMNRTPRTAVGIKEDGTLVFVVVDGRQKGLSDGLTGKELAGVLLELDIKDAAFLDGGASSEMIIRDKIVNSPSAGRERMLASGFVVVER